MMTVTPYGVEDKLLKICPQVAVITKLLEAEPQKALPASTPKLARGFHSLPD